MLLAALAVVSVALAACGGSSSGDSGKASTSSSRRRSSRASIDVWIMDPGSPKIQSVIKGYGDGASRPQNPGTKVNDRVRPAGRRRKTSSRRRSPAARRPTWPRWARRGRPSSPTRARFEQVANPPSGKYVSSLIDAATLDGKVYGKPWYAGARALIYRKDVLAKAGVKPPKTWDELLAASQGDQGQGPGDLPDRLHRPDRAHVPADDLAGAAGRSPSRTATRGRRS